MPVHPCLFAGASSLLLLGIFLRSVLVRRASISSRVEKGKTAHLSGFEKQPLWIQWFEKRNRSNERFCLSLPGLQTGLLAPISRSAFRQRLAACEDSIGHNFERAGPARAHWVKTAALATEVSVRLRQARARPPAIKVPGNPV